MSDETLGELSRRLDRLETRSEKALSDLDARCSNRASTHVDTQLYAAERNHMNIAINDAAAELKAAETRLADQIEELKGRMRWAWRAALTGLAFPIVAGIVVAAFLALRGEPPQ